MLAGVAASVQNFLLRERKNVGGKKEEGELVHLNRSVHLKDEHGGGLVVGGMIYASQSAVNID